MQLADVLLFAAFFLWAGLDQRSMARRTPRAIPTAVRRAANDVITVVVGIAIYAAFVLWLQAA